MKIFARTVLVCVLLWPPNASPQVAQRGRRPLREVHLKTIAGRFVPSLIQVDAGDRVRFIIDIGGPGYSFAMEDFGVDTTLRGAGATVVEVATTQSGNFEFGCSGRCGILYADLRGQLVVTSLAEDEGVQNVPTVSICEVIKDPNQYDSRWVRLQGEVRLGVWEMHLYDGECGGLWLSNTDLDPETYRLLPRARRRAPVPLKIDDRYLNFRKIVTEGILCPASDDACDGLFKNQVHAEFVGRVDILTKGELRKAKKLNDGWFSAREFSDTSPPLKFQFMVSQVLNASISGPLESEVAR